ncbi:MAG: hypothetical protein JXA20_02880 [Spirochaetes bacterium]|nr:hypothetical protein [Spirochaetota bacterium]
MQDRFIDDIYEFRGEWDVPSLCGLRVVKGEKHHTVIATELYDKNPGTSITAFVEQLAAMICRDYSLDTKRLVFIVRCPDRGSKLENYRERFDRVSFTIDGGDFADPDWSEITREEAAALVGEDGDD